MVGAAEHKEGSSKCGSNSRQRRLTKISNTSSTTSAARAGSSRKLSNTVKTKADAMLKYVAATQEKYIVFQVLSISFEAAPA